MLIWQDMSNTDKENIIKEYECIRKQIKRLNSIKANTEKKRLYTEQETLQYNNDIKNLQKRYNCIEIYYRCNYCSNLIKLSFDKIKGLLKGNIKPLFCNRKCSGIYYANKQHASYSEEDNKIRNAKISNTLKIYEKNLSKEQKLKKYSALNSYWKDLNNDQRSIRNKVNLKKAWETAVKNNTFGQSKDENLIYEYISTKDIIINRCIYKHGFNYDFEIIQDSQVTLVELNGIYWHHNKPFKNTSQDIAEYNNMIAVGGHKSNIANKWRYSDVAKLNYCIEHNINYICMYFDNKQIKQHSEEVGKIILDNLNKGIKIISCEELSELIADIG